MDDNKQLREVADYYGMELQMEKLIEECAELCAAAARMRLHMPVEGAEQETPVRANFFEEVADVYNMLDQIVYLYAAETRVDTVRRAKIARTEARICRAGEGGAT